MKHFVIVCENQVSFRYYDKLGVFGTGAHPAVWGKWEAMTGSGIWLRKLA